MRNLSFFQTRVRSVPCLAVVIMATALCFAQVDPAQVDPIKLVDLVAQSHGQPQSLGPGPPVKIGDWRAEGTITLFK